MILLQASNLTLHDVEQSLNLMYVRDAAFFPEWANASPQLSETDHTILDRAKDDFIELVKYSVSEELVKMVILSPLLSVAGFYRYPFQVKTEQAVEIDIDDGESTIRGRIDVLVLQAHLWVIVVEAKQAGISIHAAIPQALTYLMSAPNEPESLVGLVTNGSEFMFLKVKRKRELSEYGLSRLFSLFNPGNELVQVAGILKTIAQ